MMLSPDGIKLLQITLQSLLEQQHLQIHLSPQMMHYIGLDIQVVLSHSNKLDSIGNVLDLFGLHLILLVLLLKHGIYSKVN
jgi:hypothetical protein